MRKKLWLRKLWLMVLGGGVSVASAGDLTIFDVRLPVALSDSDKIFKDFYINGGVESGLRPGMVITVTRRTPLYDSYQNRSPGDLVVRVARIKIIHSQEGISVARLHSEFPREDMPILEDSFVMVGDKLDVTSAVMEKSGGKDKKAESALANPSFAPAVAAAPAPTPSAPLPTVSPPSSESPLQAPSAVESVPQEAPKKMESSDFSSQGTLENPILQ